MLQSTGLLFELSAVKNCNKPGQLLFKQVFRDDWGVEGVGVGMKKKENSKEREFWFVSGLNDPKSRRPLSLKSHWHRQKQSQPFLITLIHLTCK